MDFANIAQSVFSDHVPHLDCLSDEVDLTQDEAPSFEEAAPERARAGIQLRLPPYYVLQSGDVRRWGIKDN